MFGHTVAVRHITIAAQRRDHAGTAAEVSNTLQAHTNQSSSQSESNRFVYKFGGLLFGLVAGSYEECIDKCTERNATTSLNDKNNRR